jgi:putative ubiquitin-RnfH superfamily antitoxin RatB of RatAB toxin-antitoxin module
MPDSASLTVTLCWSLQPRQVFECTMHVPEGSTVKSVLEQSMADGMAGALPADVAKLSFLQPGIWGRKVTWGHQVQAEDRIELYRELKVDPKVARRQRFKRQGKGRTGLFANRKSGVAAGY